MKIIKKTAAVLIFLAMVLGLSSCGDTTWAFKSGNITMTSGMYLTLLLNVHSQAQSKVEDQEKDIFLQKIENKPAEQWIKDKVQEAASQYLAIESKFQEYKLTITDAEMEQVNTSISDQWKEMKEYYEHNGSSKQSYEKIVLNATKSQKVFEYLYERQGSPQKVSDSALKSHFMKTYHAVKMLEVPLVDPQTGAALDETGKKAAQTKADDFVKQFKKSKNVDTIIKNYMLSIYPEDQKQQIQQYSDFTSILSSKDQNASPELLAALPKMKLLQTQKITSTQSITVAKKYDMKEYGDQFESFKKDVLTDLKSPDFEKQIKDWVKALKITTNADAISFYSPKNIQKAPSVVAQEEAQKKQQQREDAAEDVEQVPQETEQPPVTPTPQTTTSAATPPTTSK